MKKELKKLSIFQTEFKINLAVVFYTHKLNVQQLHGLHSCANELLLLWRMLGGFQQCSLHNPPNGNMLTQESGIGYHFFAKWILDPQLNC